MSPSRRTPGRCMCAAERHGAVPVARTGSWTRGSRESSCCQCQWPSGILDSSSGEDPRGFGSVHGAQKFLHGEHTTPQTHRQLPCFCSLHRASPRHIQLGPSVDFSIQQPPLRPVSALPSAAGAALPARHATSTRHARPALPPRSQNCCYWCFCPHRCACAGSGTARYSACRCVALTLTPKPLPRTSTLQ